MNTTLTQIKNKKSGFVLLVAILTASFLLAVGLGVSSLAIRGFQLTGNTTESIKALYAANAGIECALYWDLKYPTFPGNAEVFPLKTDITAGDYIAYRSNIDNNNTVGCSQSVYTGDPNKAVGIDYVPSGTQSKVVAFYLSFRTKEDTQDLSGNAPCVYVMITKKFSESDLSKTQVVTTVDAYGYNLHGIDGGGGLTCTPSNIVSSPTGRVERLLEATY
jgi:hypothetical protein